MRVKVSPYTASVTCPLISKLIIGGGEGGWAGGIAGEGGVAGGSDGGGTSGGGGDGGGSLGEGTSGGGWVGGGANGGGYDGGGLFGGGDMGGGARGGGVVGVEASVDGEGALGALKALATVAALVEEEGWQARVVEKANNPTIVGKHRQSGTQSPIRGIVTRCR